MYVSLSEQGAFFFFFFCSLFYVDTNFLFVNLQIVLSQQTFQRRLNVAFRLIWRRDVAQRQINIETRMRTSTLKSTTFNKVETKLCISMLNWTTLDNVETTLRIWPFQKKKTNQPRFKSKIIFLRFKEYTGLKIFFNFSF